MDRKRTIIISAIGLLIGFILLGVGLPKCKEANQMLDMGIEYGFGSRHMEAWSENLAEAKPLVWGGIAVCAASAIFLVIGICIKSHDSDKAAADTQAMPNSDSVEAFGALAELYEKGLITEEEFKAKKEELLNRL